MKTSRIEVVLPKGPFAVLISGGRLTEDTAAALVEAAVGRDPSRPMKVVLRLESDDDVWPSVNVKSIVETLSSAELKMAHEALQSCGAIDNVPVIAKIERILDATNPDWRQGGSDSYDGEIPDVAE